MVIINLDSLNYPNDRISAVKEEPTQYRCLVESVHQCLSVWPIAIDLSK